MAVMVHGDDAQLAQLRSSLDRLASPRERLQINQRLGAAALTRVGLEFEQSQDPYGRAWQPAGRGGQTLRDTGNLANSFNFKAAGDDFRLGTAVKYAGVHQYGATIRAKNKKYLLFKVNPGAVNGASWVRVKQVTIPQRQMVPEDDLGPIWFADFDLEVSDFMSELFGS